MKKRSIAVAILVVLLLSMTALAANRAVTTFADVTVTGTSANCTVDITGARNDEIDVVIKLFENGRRIQTWTDSATTYYRFNETARVNGGGTYTLTVDYSVNGVSQPSISVSDN